MGMSDEQKFKVGPARNHKRSITALCWDCGEIIRERKDGETSEAVAMFARRHVANTGHEVQVQMETSRTFAATPEAGDPQ